MNIPRSMKIQETRVFVNVQEMFSTKNPPLKKRWYVFTWRKSLDTQLFHLLAVWNCPQLFWVAWILKFQNEILRVTEDKSNSFEGGWRRPEVEDSAFNKLERASPTAYVCRPSTPLIYYGSVHTWPGAAAHVGNPGCHDLHLTTFSTYSDSTFKWQEEFRCCKYDSQIFKELKGIKG